MNHVLEIRAIAYFKTDSDGAADTGNHLFGKRPAEAGVVRLVCPGASGLASSGEGFAGVRHCFRFSSGAGLRSTWEGSPGRRYGSLCGRRSPPPPLRIRRASPGSDIVFGVHSVRAFDPRGKDRRGNVMARFVDGVLHLRPYGSVQCYFKRRCW